MENVSKHHSEKKGESYCSIDCWINFFIKWHSIGIDYLLERPHEVIRFNMSRPWILILIELLKLDYLRTSFNAPPWAHLSNFVLKNLLVLRWAPEEAGKKLLAIIWQLVQLLTYSFLLDYEPFHDLYLGVSMILLVSHPVKGLNVFLELLFSFMNKLSWNLSLLP